jgi:protein phosphatase
LQRIVTSPAPFVPPSPQGEITVQVFGRTDVGRTREHNEDYFLVADLSGTFADGPDGTFDSRSLPVGGRGWLFMVADGLGGAAAGEIASDLAVTTVLAEMRERWSAASDSGADAFALALKAAAEAANRRIFEYAATHPEHRGLGTTATIAGLLGDTLYMVQVGDSRGYLVRHDVPHQITKDQSLMQRLIEAGELTEEEAARSERRNIILQALGPETIVKIDLTYQQVRRGDVLVLCTDGLSGVVHKDEIAATLAAHPDLGEASKVLIDRANENGGPDNVTAVLARFDGPGLAAPADTDLIEYQAYPLPGDTLQTPASARRREEFVTMPMPVPVPDPQAAAPVGRALPRQKQRATRTIVLALALAAVAIALLLARHLPRPAG